MTTNVTTETRTTVPEPEAQPRVRGLGKPMPYLEAGREVFHVLDAIRDVMGLDVAIAACNELRTAAQEGMIAGDTYGTEGDCVACAYGTLGRITGFDDDNEPSVPGWHNGLYLTPLEHYVSACREGDTPGGAEETSEVLETLIAWCNQWEQDRA